MTIVIMGILAAVVLPRFGGGFVEGLTLRTATSGITSDIRYTRQLAITNADHYLINFDFITKEYRIYRNSISSSNQVGETKKIPSGVTCSGTNQFDFYSLGNAAFNGSGLNLSLAARQYRIRVEPSSGAVVVE